MKDWALVGVLVVVAVVLILSLRGRTEWSGGWQLGVRDALSGIGRSLRGAFGGVRLGRWLMPRMPSGHASMRGPVEVLTTPCGWPLSRVRA